MHVGNYEIERCPLPRLEDDDIKKACRYSKLLKRLYRALPFGDSGRLTARLEYEVDAWVLLLYGADPKHRELLLSRYYNTK